MDIPLEVQGQAGELAISVASGMLWGRDAGPCKACVEVVVCLYWGGCCRESSAET